MAERAIINHTITDWTLSNAQIVDDKLILSVGGKALYTIPPNILNTLSDEFRAIVGTASTSKTPYIPAVYMRITFLVKGIEYNAYRTIDVYPDAMSPVNEYVFTIRTDNFFSGTVEICSLEETEVEISTWMLYNSVSVESISDEIAHLQDSGLTYYFGINKDKITIGPDEIKTICTVDYHANEQAYLVFTGEFKLKIDTVEEETDDAYTEYDANIRVFYYVNNRLIRVYNPEDTYAAGMRLLSLMHWFRHGNTLTSIFRADMEVENATVEIAPNDGRGYVMSKNFEYKDFNLVIVSEPTKTKYYSDGHFDWTGLVVAKSYATDGTKEIITNLCVIDPPDGAAVSMVSNELDETQEVMITYTERNYWGEYVDYVVSFFVYITRVVIEKIEVTTLPTNQIFWTDTSGWGTVNYKGMVITGTTNNGLSVDVTNSEYLTISPENGHKFNNDDILDIEDESTEVYVQAIYKDSYSEAYTDFNIYYDTHWTACGFESYYALGESANFWDQFDESVRDDIEKVCVTDKLPKNISKKDLAIYPTDKFSYIRPPGPTIDERNIYVKRRELYYFIVDNVVYFYTTARIKFTCYIINMKGHDNVKEIDLSGFSAYYDSGDNAGMFNQYHIVHSFSDLTSLEKLTLPSETRGIWSSLDYVFRNDKSLVTIGNAGVSEGWTTELGIYTFANCENFNMDVNKLIANPMRGDMSGMINVYLRYAPYMFYNCKSFNNGGATFYINCVFDEDKYDFSKQSDREKVAKNAVAYVRSYRNYPYKCMFKNVDGAHLTVMVPPEFVTVGGFDNLADSRIDWDTNITIKTSNARWYKQH